MDKEFNWWWQILSKVSIYDQYGTESILVLHGKNSFNINSDADITIMKKTPPSTCGWLHLFVADIQYIDKKVFQVVVNLWV